MLTTKSDLLNVSADAVAAFEAERAAIVASAVASGAVTVEPAAIVAPKPVRTPKPKAVKPEKALPLVSPSGKRIAVKPETDAKPVAAKTVKPVKLTAAKPKTVVSDAVAAEQAKHLETIVATRAAVAKRYSGASKAFHTSRQTSPADILAVIASPNHRIADGKPPTVRDASLAHVLVGMPSGSDALPVLTLGADLGVISRLASIGCFAVRNGKAVIVSQAAMRAVTRECRPTAEQLKPKAA